MIGINKEEILTKIDKKKAFTIKCINSNMEGTDIYERLTGQLRGLVYAREIIEEMPTVELPEESAEAV